MTVAELRERLSKYPDDMEVCKSVYDYEYKQSEILYIDEIYEYISKTKKQKVVVIN